MIQLRADQPPAPGEVAGVLREILAGPEFATFEDPNMWRVLAQWLWSKFMAFMAWLQRYVGEQNEIGTILVALAALLVLVMGWRIAARHAPKWIGAADEEQPATEPVAPTTAVEWLSIADARAGRGDLRPAATALYQGFLLTLDRQGVVSFDTSKTPGDYAHEIAGHDTETAGGTRAGSRFLDSFQGFSFGAHRPTPAGYGNLARLAREAGCAPASAPRTAETERQPTNAEHPRG